MGAHNIWIDREDAHEVYDWDTQLEVEKAVKAPEKAFYQKLVYPENLFQKNYKLLIPDPKYNSETEFGYVLGIVEDTVRCWVKIQVLGCHKSDSFWYICNNPCLKAVRGPNVPKDDKRSVDITNIRSPVQCRMDAGIFQKKLKRLVENNLAPLEWFKPVDKSIRIPNRFKIGQKLETLDMSFKNFSAQMYRATVESVQKRTIKVMFDDFADEYSLTFPYDSVNIFPCGWHAVAEVNMALDPAGSKTPRRRSLKKRMTEAPEELVLKVLADQSENNLKVHPTIVDDSEKTETPLRSVSVGAPSVPVGITESRRENTVPIQETHSPTTPSKRSKGRNHPFLPPPLPAREASNSVEPKPVEMPIASASPALPSGTSPRPDTPPQLDSDAIFAPNDPRLREDEPAHLDEARSSIPPVEEQAETPLPPPSPVVSETSSFEGQAITKRRSASAVPRSTRASVARIRESLYESIPQEQQRGSVEQPKQGTKRCADGLLQTLSCAAKKKKLTVEVSQVGEVTSQEENILSYSAEQQAIYEASQQALRVLQPTHQELNTDHQGTSRDGSYADESNFEVEKTDEPLDDAEKEKIDRNARRGSCEVVDPNDATPSKRRIKQEPCEIEVTISPIPVARVNPEDTSGEDPYFEHRIQRNWDHTEIMKHFCIVALKEEYPESHIKSARSLLIKSQVSGAVLQNLGDLTEFFVQHNLAFGLCKMVDDVLTKMRYNGVGPK